MGIKDIEREPDRMSCTYWEAVFALHNAKLVAPYVASVVAIIYGRHTREVMQDLERGKP